MKLSTYFAQCKLIIYQISSDIHCNENLGGVLKQTSASHSLPRGSLTRTLFRELASWDLVRDRHTHLSCTSLAAS